MFAQDFKALLAEGYREKEWTVSTLTRGRLIIRFYLDPLDKRLNGMKHLRQFHTCASFLNLHDLHPAASIPVQADKP